MLKGERVTLRGVRREDLPTLCAFNNDVQVEVAGGGDPPLPQSLERLQAEFDTSAAKGGRDESFFVMEVEAEEGGGLKVIGQCAVFGSDALRGTPRHCGLGIGIGDPAYWGRGYGREAVNLLVDYAFRHWNVNRVWLTCLACNERALRCYRACGFVEEGRLRQHAWSEGRYVDLVHMGLLRSEWEAGAKGG